MYSSPLRNESAAFTVVGLQAGLGRRGEPAQRGGRVDSVVEGASAGADGLHGHMVVTMQDGAHEDVEQAYEMPASTTRPLQPMARGWRRPAGVTCSRASTDPLKSEGSACRTASWTGPGGASAARTSHEKEKDRERDEDDICFRRRREGGAE